MQYILDIYRQLSLLMSHDMLKYICDNLNMHCDNSSPGLTFNVHKNGKLENDTYNEKQPKTTGSTVHAWQVRTTFSSSM